MQNLRVVLLLIFLPVFSSAQQDTLLIYQEEEFEGDAYIQDTLVEVHNGIKFDPLQILRGEISVFYERRISNRISVELGAGITRRSWTYSWFNTDVDDLRRNISVETGPAFRAGVRYYFMDSPEINGVYVMPQVGYRIYEKTFAELDSTGELNGQEYIDRREVGEVNLTIGYQQLSFNSNFFYDVYFGVGYGFYSGVEVRRRNVPIETLYYTEPRKSSGPIPVIGFKMGWGF